MERATATQTILGTEERSLLSHAGIRSHDPDPPPQLDEAAQAQVLRKLNWTIVPWLLSFALVCYLDRNNLGFAALQLTRDLRLSCHEYGLGAGIFFVGYTLFQVPLSFGVSRFGAPVWLGGMCVVWGAVAMVLAGISSFPAFLTLRLLLGVAESSAFPGIYQHLAAFYSPREMTSAYPKVSSANAAASVLGAPLAAAILRLDGHWGLAGWQWLFALEGGLALVFGLCMRLCMPAGPLSARFLTPKECRWLHARQTSSAALQEASSKSSLAVLRAVVLDWRVVYLALCWLVIACSMYGLLFWTPLYVKSMFGEVVSSGAKRAGRELQSLASPPPVPFPPPPTEALGCGGDIQSSHSDSVILLLSALPFLCATASMNLVGASSERLDERRLHASLSVLVGGLGLCLTPLAASTPAAAFVLLAAAAAGVWAFHGPFFSWPAQFLDRAHASAAFAVINTTGSLGGLVGPVVVGSLTQGSSYSRPMLVLGGGLCVAALALFFFPAPQRLSESSIAREIAMGAMRDDEQALGGTGTEGGPAMLGDSSEPSLRHYARA